MSESLIKLRVYKYSSTSLNGCGEELDKVMVGGKITSCLDDTLDTAEISLNGVSESEPYKPLTKFVVALEQDNQETQYFHYELRYDNVEKLSMSDNLYKHTLYLGNPAISCQKRTCDNFAISYRLKDVKLDSTSYNSGYTTKTNVGQSSHSNKLNVLNDTYGFSSIQETMIDFNFFQSGKAFYWYRNAIENYKVTDTQLTDLKNLNQNVFYDNGSLTKNICEKIKEWSTKVGSKFQIFNYDSSNAFYGTNGAYKDYFESIPSSMANGNKFHYVIPQLVAKVSPTITNDYNASSKVKTIDTTTKISDGDNIVLMPTKTVVTVTNLSTNKTQSTTYTSHPKRNSQIHSLDVGYNVDRYINGPSTKYWGSVKLGSDFNQNSCIVLGYGNYYYDNSNKDLKTFGPVYFKEVDAPTNQEIDITIEPNCKYTFETTAYFGDTWDRYCYTYDPKTLSWVEKQYNGDLEKGTCQYANYYYRNGNSIDYQTYSAKETDFKYSFEMSVYNITANPALLTLKSQNTIPTCYDLFKKAQICSKTITYNESQKGWDYVEETDFPYIISAETKTKLQMQNIIEDKYYNKNLWEMFMQIGKYIHAKPYIRFYQDKYELKFKDYGISEKSTKKATTNSLFSNNNIESYISSLDSYLENYFEYGNEVEEYIKPTDNDGSSVCSNDNAVLKTKYPIMEITGLYVSNKKTISWKDITDYVYEYNVYKCLSILSRQETSTDLAYLHYKGNSIYYHLNGTQIQGLQNIEPKSSGVFPYAIKRILGEVILGVVFNSETSETDVDWTDVASLQVNDYIFKITYRTKDDVRFKTFKPDLRKFMLNASNDNYPMQSQFSNQSDKVVDSNKYGNNTYGTLLRSGNDTLDYQEYITDISQLKDSGELYDLGNQYYVAKNTMVVYPTYVECEVEYSKDYNKLSEIIGIDSSPRFYEIAEDGSIKRNISVDKFYQIGTSAETDSSNYITLQEKSVLEKICVDLGDTYKYTYCLVRFSGATKTYNQESNDFSSLVLVPCIEYATGNTLTLECDMEDNYGAGEQHVDVSSSYASMYYNSSWLIPILMQLGVISTSKKLSGTLTKRQSYQYCDVYGKADLMAFAFIQRNSTTDTTPYINSYINDLPKGNTNILTTSNSIGMDYSILKNNELKKGIIIDKDSRETIGINYNTHLLTESDRFVLSNTLFKKKKLINGTSNIRWYIYYFDTELNKMERETLVSLGTPIYSYSKGISPITYSSVDKQVAISLKDVGVNIDAILEKTKCIALGYYDGGVRYFVIARNVNGLTNKEKINTWYFTKPKFE